MIPDFEKLMKYISRQDFPFILIIDEYQDLRQKISSPDVVDAIFRDFIDSCTEKAKIIICGSAIRVMKSLMDISNPLYKRFSMEMYIGELDYLEAALFYPERNIREKISLYAVFGGIPMILSAIDATLSIEENIRNLVMAGDGLARLYIEDVLRDETAAQSATYAAVIRIGNGSRTFGEIESMIDSKTARDGLAKALKNLISSGVLIKRQPINEQGNRKKTFYEIKINLLRFYLTYMERFSVDTSSKAFFLKYVRPSLNTFISYRFEAMVRDYFSILSERSENSEIVTVGTYWYNDRENKKNGEFDVAIETLDGYEIYEVKFLEAPMPETLVEKEKEKILHLSGLNVKEIGFVSSSGFEKEGDRRISGKDIYAL